MQAELTDHLGYEKHDPAGHNSGNSRNGATQDAEGRFWRDRTGDAAGPQRRVRAADHQEAPDAL